MPATAFGPLPGQPGYDPRLPTSAQPGLEEKIQVLEDRAARGLPLFLPGDYHGEEVPAPRAMLPAEDLGSQARAPAHTRKETLGGIRRRGHRYVARIWDGTTWRHYGTFESREAAEEALKEAA